MQEGDLLEYEGKPLKLFGLDYTELVYVEAGSFMIGNNDKEIHFDKGYYIGKYLVTQELYKAVIGTEPSNFKGKHRPVENVSYDDIYSGSESFLSNLNKKIKEEYPDLRGEFALPSETQWEYAARGGNEWDKPKLEYSRSQNINDVAWYKENSNNQTMPVGLKQPNALGIYDMSCNVWEWCADLSINKSNQVEIGGRLNPENKKDRVLRGGCYFDTKEYCRVTYRNVYRPSGLDYLNGFRLKFYYK